MIIVAAVFALRAGAAIAVVPRWQGPDEPQHFLVAASVLRNVVPHMGPPPAVPTPNYIAAGKVEEAIIRSMAREGWWAYYGAKTPDEPLPGRFVDGPFLIADVPGAAGGSRIYFTLATGVIRALGVSGIDGEYDVLRTMSAVWGLLTVLIAYASTRVWLSEEVSLVVAALLALHPQFLLVATTVSPDAFVNLCGAVAWWQVGRASAPGGGAMALVALWVAVILAALTRRLGTPMVGMAAIASAVVLFRSRQRARVGLSIAIILSVFVIAFLALVTLWPEEFQRLRSNLSLREIAIAGRGRPEISGFLWMLWQSTWLSAGWLRFPAPSWWMALASLWAALAACGVAARLMAPRERGHAVVWWALGAVSIQAAVIVVGYWGIVGAGAQGRYLFPVAVPLLTLLALGSDTALRIVTHCSVLWAAVLLMISLDLLAWTTVLIPIYAR